MIIVFSMACKIIGPILVTSGGNLTTVGTKSIPTLLLVTKHSVRIKPKFYLIQNLKSIMYSKSIFYFTLGNQTFC